MAYRHTHVVVARVNRITVRTVGPFTSEQRANDFIDKVMAKPDGLEAVQFYVVPLRPVNVRDTRDALKATLASIRKSAERVR